MMIRDLDPAVFAEQVRQEVARLLLRERPAGEAPRWLEGWPGITGETIRIDGATPHLDLVVLFRAEDLPGCLFGYRWTDIWTLAAADHEQEPDPEPDDLAVASFARLFLIHMDEQIRAEDLGLPEDCLPNTITWVGGR